MKNPFVEAARFVSVCRFKSKAQTGFISLQKVKRAVVLVEADAPDAQNCTDFVNAFFGKCNIKVDVFAFTVSKVPADLKGAVVLGRKDLKWFGRPKISPKHPAVNVQEDLLVNLVGSGIWAADWTAIASGAKMKVGRIQPRKNLYDLQILNSEGFSQSEVFKQVGGILINVR